MMGNGDHIPILEFVTNFHVGGTERQVVNLATGLDRERFEIHVGCFQGIGEFLDEIRPSGAHLTEYPIGRLLSGETLRQEARLARYIRRNRIRIVHAFGFYPNVFAVPGARLGGAQVVIASIRDGGDHLPPAKVRLQRSVCRLADRVLVNAEALRERLLSQGCAPEKVTVIPNGIDLRRFSKRRGERRMRRELGLPDSAPVVAVVSRFDQRKGIEYFLDAASAVAQRFPEVRFLMVGDGAPGPRGESYREHLERLSVRLGLTGRVVFTGLRRDVPELLTEVTVSVLPSLSEGLSNSLLESLAAGVPAVATKVGGNAEIVEDGVTGFLVPPRDPRALAAALAALLSDPARVARMGEAGRRRAAERFSREAMVRVTERLYESLLQAT